MYGCHFNGNRWQREWSHRDQLCDLSTFLGFRVLLCEKEITLEQSLSPRAGVKQNEAAGPTLSAVCV